MLRRGCVIAVLTAFLINSLGPIPNAFAQLPLNLPQIGTRIELSPSFNPLVLKGIQVSQANPLHFDVLVDKGDSHLLGTPLKEEITRLTKYFLTCLTVPDQDLWVNLSPYEHDRIAAEGFGMTIMGKELLEQDYLLKQMVASLSYPESELGGRFWKKIYAQASAQFKTTNIPVNTFNKVWIVPKSADVYAWGNSAFVVHNDLDVMLETDYKIVKKNLNHNDDLKAATDRSSTYGAIMKEIILPQLRKEVNEGKNFAGVRQVYTAMILAAWYKRHLKESFLSKSYVGQNKVRGIDVDDKTVKERIFAQYIASFRKSVYNYVKEEYDPLTQQKVARKYVSGGFDFARIAHVYQEQSTIKGIEIGKDLAMASVNITAKSVDDSFPDQRLYDQTHPFKEIPKEVQQSLLKTKARALLRQIKWAVLVSVAGASLSAQPMDPQIEKMRSHLRDFYSARDTNVLSKDKSFHQTDFDRLKEELERQRKSLSMYVSTSSPSVPAQKTNEGSSDFVERLKAKGEVLKSLAHAHQTLLLGLTTAIAAAVGGFVVGRRGVNTLRTHMRANSPFQPNVFGKGLPKVVIQGRSQVPIPTQEEEKNIKDLNEEMDRLIKVLDGTIPVHPLRDEHHVKFAKPRVGIDALAWSAAMITTGFVFGITVLPLALCAVGSIFAFRVLHGQGIVEHEIGGHGLAAIVTDPFNPATWQKAIRIHWTKSQWFDLLARPWKKMQGPEPYFLYHASSKRQEKIIQKAGPLATITYGTASTLGLSLMSIIHPWLAPVAALKAVSTVSLLTGSLMTDKGPVKDGKFKCGIVGFGGWGTVRELTVQGDRKNLLWGSKMLASLNDRQNLMWGENITQRSGLRGQHSMGIAKMRPDKNGEIQVHVTKRMITKHGLARKLISNTFKEFGSYLPPLDPQFAYKGYMLDLFEAHTRWATGGAVTVNASHPHLGPIVTMPTFYYDYEGNYVGTSRPITASFVPFIDDQNSETDGNLVTAANEHNGDNNRYRFFATDRFIKVKEMRALFTQLVPFAGELPPGDSPIIPMQILYHATQGNTYASTVFAHTEAHHRSVDEIKQDILNRDEIKLVGDFFYERIKPFVPFFSRPGLKKDDRNLKEAWVTEEMAKENPAKFEDQYEIIQKVKDFLFKEIDRARRSGELPEKLTKHWGSQGEDAEGRKRMKAFINLFVERFFIGDRETASQEFSQRADGTYGLLIQLSTDLNGFTLISRKQGVVFGYDLERKKLAFASDTYAMQETDGDGRQLKTLLYMDPKGNGECLNIQISQQTGDMHLKLYSFDRAKYLEEEELRERHQQLVPVMPDGQTNIYYAPLPPRTTMAEDIRDLSKGIYESKRSFESKSSFNYQTKEEMTLRLAAMWIERQILTHVAYRDVFRRVREKVLKLASDCQSPSSGCGDEHRQFLVEEGMAIREEKSVLMRLIRYRIATEAKMLASGIIANDVTSKELAESYYEAVIEKAASHVINRLNKQGLDEIYQEWSIEHKEPVPSLDHGRKVDFWIGGYRNGDMIATIAAKVANSLIPGLVTEAGNTNSILNFNDEELNVHSLHIALIIGDFGSHFPDLEAANLLSHAIGQRNVFGMSSRIDSTLSTVLGQRLSPESKFTRRILVAGELRQNEASTYAEAVQLSTAVFLLFHVARRLNGLFPNEKPFGISLEQDQLKMLEGFEDSMIYDAKAVTGLDEEGEVFKHFVEQGKDPKSGAPLFANVNELLVKRDKRIARRYLETIISNTIFISYVIGYFTMTGGSGIVTGLLHKANRWTTLLEEITTVTLGYYIIPRLVQWSLGWHEWFRLGAPKNINTVAMPGYEGLSELFKGTIFSRASKSTGSEPHSANMMTNVVSKLPRLMGRGSIISVHWPADERLRDIAGNAIGQLKVTRTSPLGIFTRWLSGAVSMSTSRTAEDDPHNVVIGGKEFAPPAPKEGQIEDSGVSNLRKVYNYVVDPFGGYLADKYEWYRIVHYSTLGRRLRTYEDTTGKAAADTTQTPIPGVDKPPVLNRDRALTVVQSGDHHKGGIDMDSRLMKFKVSENENYRFKIDEHSIPATPLAGVVPEVVQVVPVTPVMLKTFLGDINLN